jgi:hypothetical protein
VTPRDQITAAASGLRLRKRAVPGFCEPLAALLEACAADPGVTGELALAVARDILPPRRRTGNRSGRNDHA